MKQQRRNERDRGLSRCRRLKRGPRLWSWNSQWLLVQQHAWLSLRERDKRDPPFHYNLHVQPVYGNLDYHNYHIRYLSVREGEYAWSVVDAPAGREKSHRVYHFSERGYIRDVVEMASSLLVADILDDVGDTSLWFPLAESLALVLFDLYRYDLEMSARRER